MPIHLLDRAPAPLAQPGTGTASGRLSLRLAWVALLLLLLAGLPLFLCMPLYADVTARDVVARSLLRGGVHYRDVFDNHLPGMTWLRLGIRRLLGWRSEAIRLVDFLAVAAAVGLLVFRLRPLGLTRAARVWAAVVLFGFYLATPEVCHGQPDMWMLVPALAALSLRGGQLAALLDTRPSPRGVAVRAVAEGFCWGMAVWIKPFVFIPGLACWLVTAVQARRAPARAGGVLLADAAGLLAGGLLAGGPGLAWLWWSGSWPSFWETLLGWNADYYHAATNGPARRTAFLLRQFPPWGWVHVAAVPLAVWALWRAVARPAPAAGAGQEALLAGFYLGWLAQANYLQYGFLYHLAPAVLLGLAVVAGRLGRPGRSPPAWLLLAGFLAWAAARHPLGDFGRTALWGRCWREGGTPELWNRLALTTEPRRPDWVALGRVAAFLRGQGLRDGELTCYSFGTNPLYLELNLTPSTRFVSGVEEIIHHYPRRRGEVRAELAASPQRFIVTDVPFLEADLQAAGVLRAQAAEGSEGRLVLAPDYATALRARYPWSEPVIFRAGPYLVHRSIGSLRR
jgi:hypothetical protein